MGNIMTNVCEV